MKAEGSSPPTLPDRHERILEALRSFADAVAKKFGALTSGEPEDQLRRPFEEFIEDVGEALSLKGNTIGESRAGRLGFGDERRCLFSVPPCLRVSVVIRRGG